ncbi:MAG: exodeoxyribonuclease III [Candidatus Magasanikbacteria bacterium]|mgnify:CR=1 FL=1|jgi:exodeoxyribonuclease III|nr:exodeoxyribonuclease III [Candidatus Magasanikbacteria bacterium]MBT4314580.1 exodeoxyribonuclease III [Candidatus Magasanikbacteria bacterium]MBT4546787.1 exodeoxyribonuclease III [Candidatus Magasanikbacteria bacterium]MBT6818796.1 exodeoxyribonuclease III [Candidatus Magasanikbacteria bacterium]
MKLVSWNVNGIRAVIRKDFGKFLQTKKPDIICLQEVKIDDVMRAKENFDFEKYEEYWNSADRPGYSGTAIFIKSKLKLNPIYTTGIGIKKYDSEGRVQTLEFKKFFLVNVYFPNTREDLSRLDFKIDFNNKISKHVKKLEKTKPVIITGDFNVAHEEIDLARPKPNNGKAGFHPRERAWMTKFLDSDMIDTFRHKNPDKIQYSWWTYRFGARSRNVGWRIDYFCVSDKLKNKIKKAEIWNKVKGSDHCPVVLNIDL